MRRSSAAAEAFGARGEVRGRADLGIDAMRGFTLIELVACIAIIAVLAALAGPRFVGTQSFDERGYADELAAALRYADGVAVATGCNVSFTVTAVGPTAGYNALQQPGGVGNTCAAAGAYTQQVVRADGTALSGTPPVDANVVTGGTIVFGAAGGVVSAPPVPSFSIGPFTITVDASSGFVTGP